MLDVRDHPPVLVHLGYKHGIIIYSLDTWDFVWGLVALRKKVFEKLPIVSGLSKDGGPVIPRGARL